VIDQAHQVRSFQQLYDSNGLQFLPFNTLYQLVAEQRDELLQMADSLLLIPDLINFWLTGVKVAERTNASTTGLLNVTTREWDADLVDVLGFPRTLLPRLVSPGEAVGPLVEQVADQAGLQRGTPVTAVGSHDTASAVVAVPTTTENFAYISSGTWSLVGLELDSPVISESSRAANFTNEGGVDGRIRFLKNVSGLWLLSESIRAWEEELASDVPLKSLLREAAAVTRPMPVFDAGDPRFIAPGDMPKRIADWCVEHGLDAPQTPAEFVRCILESLAFAYADALDQASRLAGRRIDVIHVVGGGSQNALLCQLTADAAGVPVVAGPVEATAIGNVLVQARSLGLIEGSLESLRARLASQTSLATFVPSSARIGGGRVP
jgi:rhamnulokinase